MTSALTISGSKYTVTGTVKNEADGKGIVDLRVFVYDEDFLQDDLLGVGVTDDEGKFVVSFDASILDRLFDRSPDLYFVVQDAGLELLNTQDDVIENADTSTPAINLSVDISNDLLRQQINKERAPGWVGGYAQSKPAFAYPEPDLSSLPMLDNMDNIDKLQRQQKVLWPEFSWATRPGEADPKRCYQMFAPGISRLGYTDEGRVYSIICPQQGVSSPNFGSMNVEVTVTGNRGWADEASADGDDLAADMTVVGKIWFSPSACKTRSVRKFGADFDKRNLPFPWDKAHAIEVTTHKRDSPDEPIFPLKKGPSTDFPIPNFAEHKGIAWSMGHLGVQIGPIKPTGFEEVDQFNQFVLDIFNVGSGNMLQNGNVLTWNVWFTAPGLVDRQEWQNHANKWRESIQADHATPGGPGTKARYFDGTPYEPVRALLDRELPRIIELLKERRARGSG